MSSTQSLKVGYVGLGLMGGSMARNMLKAGFQVVIFNRSPAKVDAILAEFPKTAVAGTSPSDVARQVDVVFTNLPDSSDVLEVVFGPNGIASSIRPGAVFVDNSTIKPSVSMEIARRLREERQVDSLDAPVSGGDIGAQNGTLSIMVGGAAAALEKVRPCLAALGKRITHLGGPGAGQVCKGANQIMVAAQMVAMGEMLVFAKKCGVDGEKMIDAVKGGAAQCWTLDVKPPRLFAGNRDPGFKASMQSKDLGIVLDTAREFGVPLPTTAVNDQLFRSMLEQGNGGQDNSAVISVLEAMSNCKI